MMSTNDRLKWAAAGWLIGSLSSVFLFTWIFYVSNNLELDARLDSRDSLLESVLTHVSPVQLFFFQLPLWAGMVGAPLIARKYKLNWRKQLGWRIRIIDIPIGIISGSALQLAIIPILYNLLSAIINFFGFSDIRKEDVERVAEELVDTAHTPVEVAFLILMSIIFAPLVEEIFYRGLVQGALQDRFKSALAIVAVSIIFGVTHFQLLQLPGLLVVGAVQGILFWHTERIGASVLSHMSFNAITIFYLL